MTYQVTEFYFDDAKPLYADFYTPITIVTGATQEVFVNFQHYSSMTNAVPLQIAVFKNKMIYGSTKNVFYILDGGRVQYEHYFDEDILEIYVGASGTVLRMKSCAFVKTVSDEYIVGLPLRELVASRDGLYGLCKDKLVALTRIPYIVMECSLTRVFYDGHAIGINQHKRLAIYDRKGCRGYLAENVKVKRFVVLESNIIVCFTKDQRIITLGLQLEYYSVKFVVLGNISSALWQQGTSYKFVEAYMHLGAGGLGIIRDNSVLLIAAEQIMSKVPEGLLDYCKNEYELIRLTATSNVECGDESVAYSLKNTLQILQGVAPFGRDIREYRQVMQRFCAIYYLALNQYNGAYIDFNPFIAEMQKNLTQIQDQFVAFIKRKIPPFEIREGQCDKYYLNTNQELFMEFAEYFNVYAYEKKRAQQIRESQTFYIYKVEYILTEATKATHRERTIIEDAFCGILEPEEQFYAPASDPPVKKVVKKVVVKRIIKKTVKTADSEQIEQVDAQNTGEVNYYEDYAEPVQDPLADKPKVKKITTVNKVVIKKPQKVEDSSDEEYLAFYQRMYQYYQEQKELIAYRRADPVAQVQVEYQAELLDQVSQPAAEYYETVSGVDTKKKPSKISFINKIKFSKPSKPEAVAEIEESPAEYPEEVTKSQQPSNAHSRIYSHANIAAEDSKGLDYELPHAVDDQPEPYRQAVRRPSQDSAQTDFYKQVAAEFGQTNSVLDPNFVPTFYTSPLLVPPYIEERKRYCVTDETVLYSARNNALAQLETFNTFTRAQELSIFDEIYKSILGQVMMIVPQHSIIQSRFLILPTVNAQESFFLRAYDLRMHREVACRILPDFMNHKANQYFINKLEHPNLVRILSVGPIKAQNGKMQCAIFVEKPYYYSLKQILEHHIRLFKNESQIRYFARYILQLLKYLNCSKMHLIHRDVSPEQIFINPQTLEVQLFHTGQIRATDFNEPVCQQTIYAAPEVLCGIAAPQSDIWSLGVCVFRLLELAAGQEPISLFEPGGFGLSEAPPPGANGEVLTPAIANCCVCIANQVANASDFIELFEDNRGCVCRREAAASFVTAFANRIQVMPATGKMPWDIETSGFEREDAVGSLPDISQQVRDFVKACWVFDYQNRLEAEWMLALEWIKEEK